MKKSFLLGKQYSLVCLSTNHIVGCSCSYVLQTGDYNILFHVTIKGTSFIRTRIICRMNIRYRVQNTFVNLMRHNSHLISEHTQAKMCQRPSAATSTIWAKVGRANFKLSYLREYPKSRIWRDSLHRFISQFRTDRNHL